MNKEETGKEAQVRELKKTILVLERMINNPKNSQKVRDDARATVRQVRDWYQELLLALHAQKAEPSVPECPGFDLFINHPERQVEEGDTLATEGD